jgi:hypothetical protein
MVLGLTTDNIELIALIAIGVFLVIGLVCALAIKAIVGRLIALLLMVALAALVMDPAGVDFRLHQQGQGELHQPRIPGKTTCRFFRTTTSTSTYPLVERCHRPLDQRGERRRGRTCGRRGRHRR